MYRNKKSNRGKRSNEICSKEKNSKEKEIKTKKKINQNW